jgi:RNA-dependent RNA polymerase
LVRFQCELYDLLFSVQYTDHADGKNKNLVGTVVVTRSPSLHPGDIRIVTAASVTKYPRLAHLVDVVVFSQQGEIPIPQMTAGGDLDGDTFFVTWDTRLVPDKNFPSMDYKSPPALAKNAVTLRDIKRYVFRV